MTRAASPKHRRRQFRPWPVVAVMLWLIAAGCLTAGLQGRQVPLLGPAAPPGTSPTLAPDSARIPFVAGPVVADAPQSPAGATVPHSTPIALRVPAIGLAVSLSTLGLNPDQTVQVPTNFQEPGWFRLGPSPGERGSAVILGHVDSYTGPAVFFRLRDLNPGDQVDVTLADGVVAHFVVNTVVMYPKDQFPAQQVYASHDYSALQLVTCGGVFDTHARSYLSNTVVYTTLATTTPATAPADPASQN